LKQWLQSLSISVGTQTSLRNCHLQFQIAPEYSSYVSALQHHETFLGPLPEQQNEHLFAIILHHLSPKPQSTRPDYPKHENQDLP